MGIYWRNASYRWVRFALDDVSLCRLFRRRPIGTTSGYRNHGAHLHTHLSKHGNDDGPAPNHRCTITLDQLQRLLCANDHVRPRAREQRLDSPKNSRLTKAVGRDRRARCALAAGFGHAIYFTFRLSKLGRDTWKPITRSSWRSSKVRWIYSFTWSSRMRSTFTTFRLSASLTSTSNIFKRSKS